MDYKVDAAVERRLDSYIEHIGDVLANKRRRESFAIYAMGLLSDAERKSVEPLAARACADPEGANPAHQRLLHFIAESQWNDHGVRRTAAQYALAAIGQRESVSAWIVDDTGFLKQGKHSVGVQRQYTGSAGKVTNCQIGVSLSLATPTIHLPVDFELYLPESWTEDRARRRECGVPKDVEFYTKPALALRMIRRALLDGLPRGVVLADAGYGSSSGFRAALRAEGLHYAVGIEGSAKVWRIGEKRRCAPKSVRELALGLGIRRYRKVTWRQGSKQALWSWFACCRVVPCHDDGTEPAEREEVWLLIEWPPNESEPTKYTLATLPPRTPLRELVRVTKERWRTERVYEDLKGELGLDHFEGRRYRGWHHHVSVALCCYAFVVAEQVRSFPPSAERTYRSRPHAGPPRASFRRFVHHVSARNCSAHRTMAPPLSPMPSRTTRTTRTGIVAEGGAWEKVIQ
jgi:SRSO17 transposase